MSEPIAVPDVFARRIDGYLQQQEMLQSVVQTAVATAAELLGVPQGWQYNPATRMFHAPPASPLPAPDAEQGA